MYTFGKKSRDTISELKLYCMYCIPLIDTKINKNVQTLASTYKEFISMMCICVRGYNGGLNLKYDYGPLYVCILGHRIQPIIPSFNTDFPGKKMC